MGMPECPEFACFTESKAKILKAFADWELEILVIILGNLLSPKYFFMYIEILIKTLFFSVKIIVLCKILAPWQWRQYV